MSDPTKFMFDLYDFGDPSSSRKKDEPPPPPTFSEAELEAARQEAFARGKAEGIHESEASREQEITRLLVRIADMTRTMMAAEHNREKTYERESVALAAALLERLFPALNARHGISEVCQVIQTILTQMEDASEIVIETAPDDLEPIKARIASHIGDAQKLTLRENPSLHAGDCKVIWKDGGAVRNAAEIADRIADELSRTLDGRGRSGQDEQ